MLHMNYDIIVQYNTYYCKSYFASIWLSFPERGMHVIVIIDCNLLNSVLIHVDLVLLQPLIPTILCWYCFTSTKRIINDIGTSLSVLVLTTSHLFGTGTSSVHQTNGTAWGWCFLPNGQLGSSAFSNWTKIGYQWFVKSFIYIQGQWISLGYSIHKTNQKQLKSVAITACWLQCFAYQQCSAEAKARPQCLAMPNRNACYCRRTACNCSGFQFPASYLELYLDFSAKTVCAQK